MRGTPILREATALNIDLYETITREAQRAIIERLALIYVANKVMIFQPGHDETVNTLRAENSLILKLVRSRDDGLFPYGVEMGRINKEAHDEFDRYTRAYTEQYVEERRQRDLESLVDDILGA